MSSRPNILWSCTDQQRWDTIAALGNAWSVPAAQETKQRLLRASFDLTVRCSDPGPPLIGYF